MLGALAVVALASGGIWLATWPGFHLAHLEVVGLSRVSERDVTSAARIDGRANVWLYDWNAVARRVSAVPYVGTVSIVRWPPASVRIVVSERSVDGCARFANGDVVTVDAERRVLQRGCAEANAPLYILRDARAADPGATLVSSELAQLQDDAHVLAGRGLRFTAFSHDPFDQLEAQMSDGIRVRFGDEADLAYKQREIGPILAAVGARAERVKTVDVRAPQTPVVEYR